MSVELFDIGDSKSTLQNLDWLEGYDPEDRDDHNMYNRTPVTVYTDSGSVEAEMYVGGAKYWRGFVGMRECPNDDGTYLWTR